MISTKELFFLAIKYEDNEGKERKHRMENPLLNHLSVTMLQQSELCIRDKKTRRKERRAEEKRRGNKL